jgi:flavin-dependent dehydrogenase
MMGVSTFDVLVVGTGPAGSAAAKKCAEHGLSTLMIERRGLPRDKVCSGLLLAPAAKRLVHDEFGELPKEIILSTISGLVLWVPGAGQRKVAAPGTPVTWRKELDYWMNLKAKEKGVEIRDRTSIKKIRIDGRGCKVTVSCAGVEQQLEARFVIGADGTNSTTRKLTFPKLEGTYTIAYRECYQQDLTLEKAYAYVVFPRQDYRPNFWILPKGDTWTLEGALRELKGDIRSLLAPHGFKGEMPLWKDGCLSRFQFSHSLPPGAFIPAKGRVLLVGDAARLKIPLNGEGIGTAVKSGLLAARSIVESTGTGQDASKIYIDALNPLLKALHSHAVRLLDIKPEGSKGPQTLLDALQRAYEKSLEEFEL